MVCCVNIATPPYANYQLFLVYVDGREAKQLTYDPPGIAEEPQWFPNGEEILYGFQGPWRGAQIFRIRIDGSNSIRITTDDTTSHRFPRLSPDGQKIAFETRGHPNKIWVMNVNGSNKILLSTPGTDAASPEWAPDAIRVVYRTYGNEAGLWSVNADGSNSQKLCNGIGTHHVPRISGKIVFGTYQGIYTINPDGSGFAQLTNVYVDGYPILWSRDGTKIAFRGDANGDHKKGICTIDDDGKNLKEIIDPSLEIVQSPYNRTFDWIP
jgi:Tol biopolymer transport system component